MTTLAVLAFALAALVVGSAWTVDGAQRLARRFGVSPMVIGLTVTSIGTSLPEIGTNLAAGWQLRNGLEASGIAVGNIVGSNLSQISLLLGVVAMVSTLECSSATLRRDGTMVVAAVLGMWVVCADGVATRVEGGVLITAYALYLGVLLFAERRRVGPAVPEVLPEGGAPQGLLRPLLLTMSGLVVVVFAADQLVAHGVLLARSAGVEDEIIGLGVGVGTGLPELAVSIGAVRRRKIELSLGNLLGSNITDPLLSFGAGAAMHPMRVSGATLAVDMPCWLGLTVVALMLLRKPGGLGRGGASILLGLFATYAVVRLGILTV